MNNNYIKKKKFSPDIRNDDYTVWGRGNVSTSFVQLEKNERIDIMIICLTYIL